MSRGRGLSAVARRVQVAACLTWYVYVVLETGSDAAQVLLTSYELADMSAVFNVPELVLFSVLRDVLAGEDWIDQPHVVATLQAPLLRLCARYLYVEKKRGYALNPVGQLPQSSHQDLFLSSALHCFVPSVL